ncbi:MAG: DeoR/GlpR transcriptional regulator, partial [Erysipelotrichaceae bacterium]|nr:DeoR/GlpR transcriptional regulator [Erysipelotrichaceae bacterium]
MPTKKEIRQNDIYQILLNKGQVSIKDLSASLHVTPETIRNDLNEMEKMHRAGRHHGYATSLSGINEVPLQIRERENLADKRKVGVRALQEVKDNQVLFVDAGSTYILGLPALSARKNLTIVTNGISVAYQAGLMNIDTIVLGGRLSNVGLRTYGPEVME